MMGRTLLLMDLARILRPSYILDARHERWLNADRAFLLAGYAHYLHGVMLIEPEDCDWFWKPRTVSFEEWPYTEPVVEPERVYVPLLPVVGAA